MKSKTINKIFTVLLSVILLLSSLPAEASARVQAPVFSESAAEEAFGSESEPEETEEEPSEPESTPAPEDTGEAL